LQQYVPLFLCKEDLGIAVQSAYKQRNATQIKLYRDKAKKHEDDFNQVRGACCQRQPGDSGIDVLAHIPVAMWRMGELERKAAVLYSRTKAATQLWAAMGN